MAKKKILLTCFILIFCVNVININAQNIYTRQFTDTKLIEKAEKWGKKGKWRNGFMKANPHESLNITEFYLQYKKNPKQWKALFHWLATTDLLSISKGKYSIPGSNLVANVEDSKNEVLSKRTSESHYHHIDFQYVVKGVERFGILEHHSSIPNCKYKPDVIHYDYDLGKTKFYDSTTDKFFIFFPSDWHIAKICNDTSNQNIRVIVIKVDYINSSTELN